MPAKAKAKAVKVDVSKLFNQGDEQDLDWAAGHNYDEPDAADAKNQAGKPKSPNSNDRHVRITQAASFDNFRNQEQLSGGVPPDMPPPYVAFIKTFGRGCTEDVFRNYFAQEKIENIMLVNNERALYCLIEFATREDLARALLVTGTKMQYQYPCTVDIATPEQVGKIQGHGMRQQRSMGGRSPTSPKPGLSFDRSLMGTAEQPEFPVGGGDDDDATRKGKGGGRSMNSRQPSSMALQDMSRDFFGSAEAPPAQAGGDDDTSNNNNKRGGGGRFGGRGGVNVSGASAEFSRDAFGGAGGSASGTQSPNTSSGAGGRPMFRAGSQNSIGNGSDDASDDGKKNKPAPAVMSRDMFGSAPPPPKPKEGGEDGGDAKRGGGGGGDRFARRSPNTKDAPGGGGAWGRSPNSKDAPAPAGGAAPPPPAPAPAAASGANATSGAGGSWAAKARGGAGSSSGSGGGLGDWRRE